MKKREYIRGHRSFFNDRSALSFLLLLLSADIAFIVLYILQSSPMFAPNPLLELEQDYGYASIYMFIQELWIVLLVVAIFIQTKEMGYISWSALFTYLLCDDALCIHERLGSRVAQDLDLAPIFGLRPQDVGELVVLAIPILLLLILIAWSYFRGSTNFKTITNDLLVLLSVFACFGIVLDMVHVAVKHELLYYILGIIEEGGEMIAISLVAWYVFLLNISEGRPRFSLYRRLRAAVRNRFY